MTFGQFYASGVGTGPLVLPEGVGLVAKKGQQIHLNLHLFNAGEQDISGTSGIEVMTLPKEKVVHEAHVNLGLGAELAARITEQCFYSLEAPVLRVGGFDAPYPASRIEEDFLPDLDRLLDAVDRTFSF